MIQHFCISIKLNSFFYILLFVFFSNRDLKPENVLIDREGHVRLCDFGFAQVIIDGVNVTPLQDGCGTVMYMAPELVGKSLKSTHGFPVDWWALGCVLTEMITGEMKGMEREGREGREERG